jgi:hypothetical protein
LHRIFEPHPNGDKFVGLVGYKRAAVLIPAEKLLAIPRNFNRNAVFCLFHRVSPD